MKTKIHLSLFVISFLFTATLVQAQGWGVTGAFTYTNPLTNNVGIGTTQPWTPLQVVNSVYEWNISTRSTNTTAANRNHILIQRANGTSAVTSGFVLGGITFSGFDGSGYSLGWNGGAEITAYATQAWTASARGTALSFNTTSNGTAGGVERMRIDHNGNVGIGTTTPGFNLDVQAANTFNAIVKSKTNSTGNNYSAFTAESNTASVQLLQLMGGSGMTGTLFGVNRANLGQLYTNNAPLVMGTASPYDLTIGTNNTANITVKNGGNVGIGLTLPQEKLHVQGNIATPFAFTMFHYEDTWGAGTKKLPWLNKSWNGTYYDYLYLSATGNTNSNLEGAMMLSSGKLSFGLGSNTGDQLSTTYMTIGAGGKTLIGNPSLSGFMGTPGNYLLYVQQGILTEKVKVAVCTTANWADYVFDKNYDLKTVSELESFVKVNKHLPNIPSAEEVVKEGIDMATMDAKLLEKIEELTLYIIEQNKRIDALEKK